jgi:predicted aconitase with swiveling domain
LRCSPWTSRERRRPDLATLTRLLAALFLIAGVAAPAAEAYDEVGVGSGGVLAGTVVFRGVPPRLEATVVSRHRDVCGERVPPEVLVLSEHGGVKGSVVRVEGIVRGKAPAGEVVLDIVRCRFVPHVAATALGGRVLVRNSDPILHNAHGSLDGAAVFNVALPGQHQVIDVTRRLQAPGIVPVLCGVHPHMAAWLLVHDSPYVAVTDERGAFRITDIPAGRYRVTVWHEGFRPRRAGRGSRPIHGPPVTMARIVTITPGTTTTVQFGLR